MSEKKEFIKEKIVKKTGVGKGFRSFIKILAGAIIFGVVAAGVFVLSAPYTERLLGTEAETEETSLVIIPRDEPETLATVVQSQEESESETAPLDGELINDMTEAESTEPVEEIVQEVMQEYSYSVSDLSSMWEDVANLCDELDRSIVTIRLHTIDKDIFDNERSEEGEFSGIIVAETDTEVMILTKDAVADSEDIISVELAKDELCEAMVKGVDHLMGLSVVSIEKEDITESILENIIPISLGNSYQVGRGDMLLALGSPGGAVHSTAYDWVSYVEKDVSVVDGTESHIYLGSGCSSDKGSWVLNVQGQLVGWIADSPEEDEERQSTRSRSDGYSNLMIGISEYKSILERMINASSYGYIGLRLVRLPDTDESTPKGLYVVEVVKGSPAYEAGILAGDSLMEFCNVDMRNVNSYSRVLENLMTGTDVEAIVLRDAIEEYKEISYEITIGERP